jgi:hypothetical protein
MNDSRPLNTKRRSLICFSILIGASNASTGGKFSRQRENLIREITKHYFPEGSSILNAEGSWLDAKKRKYVREEARQILVCAATRRELTPLCKALITALKQRELLIVQLGPASVFPASGPG